MIKTPYYLIDKTKLLSNMEKIAYVREHSGAKALLASSASPPGRCST
jgi:carboxynorspermidine decarboxylase